MHTTADKNIKKGFVNGPTGKIYYWTKGQGPALFLIHQSSSSSEEYAGLIPYLSDSYQLIAHDWPGHGNSDDPDHELGVEEYTAAALAVLDHLEIKKCSLLGHHGGALLAMNIAYGQPERVNKVILSGTSGPKTAEETAQFKSSLNLKKKHHLERDGQSIFDAWKRYADYIPHATADELLPPFLNNIMSRIRPYDAHYGVLGWDRNPALGSLDMDVLLIQGSLDTFVSRQEKLLDIIPNSERLVVENGGAFMFFGRPKESAEIIRAFLEKH